MWVQIKSIKRVQRVFGLVFTSKMFTRQVAMYCKPVLLTNYKVYIYVYVYYPSILKVNAFVH